MFEKQLSFYRQLTDRNIPHSIAHRAAIALSQGKTAANSGHIRRALLLIRAAA